MIIHTVVLRLKRPVTEDLQQDLIRAVWEFGQQPPFASGPGEVRTDLQLRPEGRSVSEVLLEIRFEDEEAFQSYLVDPKHRQLVQNVLEPHCESWLSVQATTA